MPPGKERTGQVVYANYTTKEDDDRTKKTTPPCSPSDPALALGTDVRFARGGARTQRLWLESTGVGVACEDERSCGLERGYHQRRPGATTARSRVADHLPPTGSRRRTEPHHPVSADRRRRCRIARF